MWRRSELKDSAKARLKNNYFGPFLICLIFALLGNHEFDVNYFAQVDWTDGLHITSNLFHLEMPAIPQIQFYGFLTAFMGLIFRMFVINPMQVGRARYFLHHTQGKESIRDLGVIFQDEQYWNVVKIMFIKDVKIVLWALCFVIPGFVKAIEYSMIPYLLAQESGRSVQDVFWASKQMTTKEKGNIFILTLSFFLWYLIFGIVWFGSWFVNPYYEATYAQLYLTLEQQHGVF